MQITNEVKNFLFLVGTRLVVTYGGALILSQVCSGPLALLCKCNE
jgi:hypothetical protein